MPPSQASWYVAQYFEKLAPGSALKCISYSANSRCTSWALAAAQASGAPPSRGEKYSPTRRCHWRARRAISFMTPPSSMNSAGRVIEAAYRAWARPGRLCGSGLLEPGEAGGIDGQSRSEEVVVMDVDLLEEGEVAGLVQQSVEGCRRLA